MGLYEEDDEKTKDSTGNETEEVIVNEKATGSSAPGEEIDETAAGGGEGTGPKAPVLTSKSPLLRQSTEMEDSGEAHDSLEENIMSLLGSHKLGLFGKNKDSSQMDNLKTDLTNLISIFYKRIPDDTKEFETGISEVQSRYRKAIQSADTYVKYIEGNKKGKFYFGRKRLNLARKIQGQMITERRLFNAAAESLKENKAEGEKLFWRDALREVRGRKIDLRAENVEIVGAGSSRIYKVQNGDGTESYIKPEERMANNAEDYHSIVAMFRNTSPEAAALLNLIEDVIKKRARKEYDTTSKGPQGETNAVVSFAESLEGSYVPLVEETDPKTGEKKSDEAIASEKRIGRLGLIIPKVKGVSFGKQVLEAIGDNEDAILLLADLGTFIDKKSQEAFSGKGTAKIRGGSTISDRNVSSYRLAERMGQGNLIAKSETIIMQDEFGRNIRANSMEGVGGMTYAEAAEYCKKNGLTLSFTPESLGQYFNMRILDLMSGQVDRHTSNFKVMTHQEGSMLYIDSVKGIDNDLAFGMLSMEEIENGYGGQNMDALVSHSYTGEEVLTVKYITQDMYDAILDYNDQMIEYDHMDLRSKEEIKALQGRINAIRKLLQDLVAAGKIRVVKTPEEMRAAYEFTKDYYTDIASKRQSWAANLAGAHELKSIK